MRTHSRSYKRQCAKDRAVGKCEAGDGVTGLWGFVTVVSCQRFWLVLVILFLAFFAFCAKKMLPPSPDRFPPRLELIRTRNRVRLELVFNEEVDPARLLADSFVVTGSSGQPLAVRGAAGGRRSNSVELWTAVQEPVLYQVRGTVIDAAGNAGRFTARFRGSNRPDTVAPRVTGIAPEPGSAGLRHPAVRVQFSEPVDTTTTPVCFFVPANLDSAYRPSWATDWQTFVLQDTGFKEPGVRAVERAEADSVQPGSVGIVYFMLMPGMPDLEGNQTRSPAFTYFTPDSVLSAVSVRGQARWKHGAVGTGVVFFNSVESPGLAPILPDGSFATMVRAGAYTVRAVADTNADQLADLASRPVVFDTREESLQLDFEPEMLPRPVKEYREE